MAIVTSVLHGDEKPTKEQIEEIRRAAKMPIVYDEDCPLLTKEQIKEFAIIAKEQRNLRKKQVVAIRLSPETAEKVKALGKGYSSVLSRIIDEAFRNTELLQNVYESGNHEFYEKTILKYMFKARVNASDKNLIRLPLVLKYAQILQ